jgi:hypothetical protein
MSVPTSRAAGFVVLREVSEGHWQLIGEAERRPGLTARAARGQAVADVTHGTAKPGEVYAVILRSEWRVALDVAADTDRKRSGGTQRD